MCDDIEVQRPCKNWYHLPTEVAIHNSPDNCWVSYLGMVYDLTELCKICYGSDILKPILAHAGKDISHWFDHRTKDIRHYVHPVTGVLVPYCPHGPIPDVNPSAPSTAWRPLDRCPWWLDDLYRIGNLTENPRPCKVVNCLAGTQSVITVSIVHVTCERVSLIVIIFVPVGLWGGQYLPNSRTLSRFQRPWCFVHLEIWGKAHRPQSHSDRKRYPRRKRSIHRLWVTRRFLYTVFTLLLQRRSDRSIMSKYTSSLPTQRGQWSWT